MRKTFNIGYEGWHDVDCGLSYEVGYGEQHALCQAFNDGKNCSKMKNGRTDNTDSKVVFATEKSYNLQIAKSQL